MSDTLKQLIGTLYFTPARNKAGEAVSKYEGVVSGIIVRRDNGEEFTIRSESPLPYTGMLKRSELSNLRRDTLLQDVNSMVVYAFHKAFPDGRVLVKDSEGNTIERSYMDLRRAPL